MAELATVVITKSWLNCQLYKARNPGTIDMKKILLGYLCVLGDQETLALLTPDELEVGRNSTLGSLMELERFLEKDFALASTMLLSVIKIREALNGQRRDGDFLLVRVTHYCALAVYQYYRGRIPYEIQSDSGAIGSEVS